MSYQPTEWKTGDIITAEKLNNIERGIGESGGGEAFIINLTQDFSSLNGFSADKTYAEVVAAVDQGIIPVVKYSVLNDTTYYYYYTLSSMGHDDVEGDICIFSGHTSYRIVSGDEVGDLTIANIAYFLRSDDTWGIVMS